jgi:hypothetical protein
MKLTGDEIVRVRLTSVVTVLALLAALLPALALATAPPAHAATNDLTINPVNARSVGTLVAGQSIAANYKWLITSDDVGNPNDSIANCVPGAGAVDPAKPGNCQWPSVRGTSGHVPIIAQGDSTVAGQDLRNAPLTLADGKYLISILADGYTIGGQHFTVPLQTTPLAVPLQANPVPLGTLRVRVFHDNAPVDGTYEANTETGGQAGQPDLSGFVAHLSDVLGEVTTDWFGNPLCTNYKRTAPDALHPNGQVLFDSTGAPVIDAANPGGSCVSDAGGDIIVPNLGSNRYGVTLSKPASKTGWAQTTTLEGAHDHDVWVINGDNGLDSEMVIGGEPVPWVQFGYIEPRALPAQTGTAHVTGQVKIALTFVGGNGGLTLPGEPGTSGVKEGGPIDRPWLSLSDLNNGDQMVYTGRGNTDGSFDIPNVPNGSYQLTFWDDNQDYIINTTTLTVANGQNTDVAKVYLSGWMSRLYGTVFIDTNGNGKKDGDEQGLPRTALTLRERDNSLMDQFTNTVTTDSNGKYRIEEAYPLTRWLVLEHFNTLYHTTGITYQGENDPQETTLLGGGVDVNVLPVLGLGGRVDWGVQPYQGMENGGIAGTVSYDTTRNELDPTYAVSEDYQPGVPNIKVHLWTTKKDPATGELVRDANGLPVKDHEIASTYTSETWEPPAGCVARQWDGTPLNVKALPPSTETCVEAPMDGFQARPSDTGTSGTEFNGSTVNGNYGFASSEVNLYPPGDPANPGCAAAASTGYCNDADPTQLDLYAPLAEPQYLRPDEYVVSIEIPDNPKGTGPMYQVTREEDVNVFDGDSYLPADNFPVTGSASTGGMGADAQGTPEAPPSQGNGFSAPCVGPLHQVHVTNQNFIDGGGSPFEGQDKPLCTEKLVSLNGNSTAAPNFNLFTPVPLPTHFWGLTINDLGLSWDTRSVEYGEAQGIPGVPMGIYDWSGRLIDTVTTDFNGFYEAIEPSTSSYNCPTPAGPCAGMYRFVGNDPGQPGAPNPTYNPRFRTIATPFQAYPGLFTVTDTAPTMVGAVILTPGTSTPVPVDCTVSPATPEVFAVSDPIVPTTGSRSRTVTGQHFGTTKGTVQVGPTTVNPSQVTWSDTSITFPVPTATTSFRGPQQVRIRSANGQWATNALTLQVLQTGYNPVIRTVGPGQQHATIQGAIDWGTRADFPAGQAGDGQYQAFLNRQAANGRVVEVYPGATSAFNPEGAYLENVVLYKKVKLQGFGPGGTNSTTGTYTRGSVISGQAFDVDGASGTAWLNLVNSLSHPGPADIPDGATVTAVASSGNAFGTGLTRAMIDGFKITGGFQQNITGNLNAITGRVTTGYGAPGAVVTQGGGLYVHAGANGLQISNNVIVGNSGSYGGGIRVGTPYAGDSNNDNVTIAFNQIRDNGGTNLAGGLAIFTGTTGYVVDHNALCGNFSAEYGGGISHYGLSDGGRISANRIWFNESYDEGGGVMIAGELPADPNGLSSGAGAVTLSGNQIVANNANDDGGGLRLLQVNNYLVRAENNVIADNLSTHEGGGVAIDDASNVQLVNNTVAENITTATAVTSDGTAAPAGLAWGPNSSQLRASLTGTPEFSPPRLLNNVFSQNKSGSWDGQMVHGLGIAGDTAVQNIWDMGSTTPSAPALQPRYGVLSQLNGGQATGSVAGRLPGTDVPDTDGAANVSPYFTRVTANAGLLAPFSVTVDVSTLRAFPGFRQSVIVLPNLNPGQLGDYHLAAGSVAVDRGIALFSSVTAPTTDFDDPPTPRYTPPAAAQPLDAGADER